MQFQNRNVATVVEQLRSSPCWKAVPLPPLLDSAGLVPAMLSFWICSSWVFLFFMLLSFRLGHVVSLEPEVTVSSVFKLSLRFCNTCGEKKSQPWFGIFGSPLSPDSGLLSVPFPLPCWGQE